MAKKKKKAVIKKPVKKKAAKKNAAKSPAASSKKTKVAKPSKAATTKAAMPVQANAAGSAAASLSELLRLAAALQAHTSTSDSDRSLLKSLLLSQAEKPDMHESISSPQRPDASPSSNLLTGAMREPEPFKPVGELEFPINGSFTLPSKRESPAIKNDVAQSDESEPPQTLQLKESVLNQAVLTGSIGQDDVSNRTQVGATALRQFPWRAICYLRMNFRNPGFPTGTERGTGWFVSPKLLITAGHCVYDTRFGGWADTVEIFPGRNGDADPNPTFVTRKLKGTSGWINNGDDAYDYGAILLDGTQRWSEPFFELHAATDQELGAETINIAGYPANNVPVPRAQYWGADRIDPAFVGALRFFYEIGTTGGDSGSPAYLKMPNGTRKAVGIHTQFSSKFGGTNSAVRITDLTIKTINAWKTTAGV